METRVAVVGVGVAGLAAMRHLASEPGLFSPVGFELRPEVGGTWVYTDRTGTDCRGYPTHNNLYDAVVCNIPKELMEAADYPLDPSLPSFLSRHQFYDYLQDYSRHFNLNKLIKFSTRVTNIRPITSDGVTKWEVTSEPAVDDVTESMVTKAVFHKVIVCNGNLAQPRMPEVAGLSEFRGRVVHSGDYRKADEYTGRRVLVMGGKHSGSELSILIAEHASQVYQIYNDLLFITEVNRPDNLTRLKAKLVRLTPHSAILSTGEEIPIDTILFCTGYMHAFPFLSRDCDVTVHDGKRISPLYKYIFHTRTPSLAFIGMRPVYPVTAFGNAYAQMKYFLQVHKGLINLPENEAMLAEIQEDNKRQPPPELRFVDLLDWFVVDEMQYNQNLAEEAGFEPYPPYLVPMKKHLNRLFTDKSQPVFWFRKHQFKVSSDGTKFTCTLLDE